MKGGGQRKQAFTNEIKEKPSQDETQQTLAEMDRAGERAPLKQRDARNPAQAGSANDAVIMLGNAFTAIITRAMRTARHRLAMSVIEATLLGQAGHGVRL